MILSTNKLTLLSLLNNIETSTEGSKKVVMLGLSILAPSPSCPDPYPLVETGLYSMLVMCHS